MLRLATAALLCVALASCAAINDATPTPPPDCTGAFAAAASADARHDSLEALYQAVRTCGSIEEWEAAFAQYSDYFIFTADARTVLSSMCVYASEVVDAPLCRAALTIRN
jgi:hypothetical protein